MTNYTPRRKRLIDTKLQLGLVIQLTGLAVVAMMLQFLYLGSRLVGELERLEGPGGELAHQLPIVLLEVFSVSILLLVPVVVAVGIVLTHRIAGPIYRFRQYLGSVARGEQSQPCRIRKGDHLQDLCDVINEATAPLLVTEEEAASDDDSRESSSAAA